MEATFFRYIFRHSWRQQIFLLLLTCMSFPFLYYSLELPKLIINKAIGVQNFVPQPPFGLAWLGPFEHVEYLMALCLIFLVLVAIRFGFRFYVNVFKGRLGERMLRRIRYELFSRVLRFPLPHFRKTSQGEIIAMITAEVEPLGGFVGEAVALPAFEGGTMLVIMVFMFMQDWRLGLAAIALFPVQAYVIPKLQRQVNLLAKERVRTVRRLSERVGEVVTGIENVHAHDTAERERADIAQWLGTIYGIRFRIYKKKYFIKFLNNFLGQLTPFFFFSIGGYLIITGGPDELTFGALVAVLAAYKDLSAPWKELLKWYEMKEDARIKYEQLVEQFDLPGMLDERMQAIPEEGVPRLSGRLVASNLTLAEEDGLRIVDAVNLSFDIGERVALAGHEGSGNSALARLLARLVLPTAGSLRVGDLDLATAPEYITGRRIGYVGQGGHLHQGSIGDNLFDGLMHQPLAPARCEEGERALIERMIQEAEEAGNTTSDLSADWIDYAAAGVDGRDQLLDRVVEVLDMVVLSADVFEAGLQCSIDPAAPGDHLAERILKARRLLRERLQEKAYRGLVDPFDPDRFNHNMSVAENLLFGTPIGPVFALENIGENPYMLSVLDKVGLTETFLDRGFQVAKIMLELFQDLAPGDEMFERFSFIDMEDLPSYQAAVRRTDAEGLEALAPSDRSLFLSLPFKLIPARHRLGLVTEETEARLLEARRAFAEGLPENLRGAVAFFDPETYNPAASVQDNILFGRLAYGRQQAQRVVGQLIGEVIDALGLRRSVIELGLRYPVGVGGSRLSAARRQKVAIARCLLKRPDLLVVDHATAALDPASQAAIMNNLMTRLDGAGLVWVVNDVDDARGFDRVVVMDHGRIVEMREGDRQAAAEPRPAAASGS